jgi:hypothetical protein
MNEGRSYSDLQCIGSFKASAQDGTCHTIEIWTYFHAVHDRDRARIAPSQLVLTTTDGYAVEWIEQGQYRLRDNPEIRFSTNDPNAP